MEQWRNLAAAVWLNPTLAHAFLAERDALLKAEEAVKRDAQKVTQK
jgi:hypothetical protein